MPGTLYIVGTPIGNLGDFSPRGKATLEAVDFIAAEDTRVSIKLLNHLEIKKPMVSYHQHNQQQAGAAIVGRLLAGENAAIVTDAGMPCISDPGQELVALCAQQGIEVCTVPGPSAFVAALAACGLPSQRFAFEGFLPAGKKQRRAHLQACAQLPHTLIFYEAPHKLLATLADMRDILGDRPAASARELTKLYEQLHRGSLQTLLDHYQATPPRGEFVLIIQGAEKLEEEQMSLEEAVDLVHRRMQAGDSASIAAKEVAQITGHKKSQLYALAQEPKA